MRQVGFKEMFLFCFPDRRIGVDSSTRIPDDQFVDAENWKTSHSKTGRHSTLVSGHSGASTTHNFVDTIFVDIIFVKTIFSQAIEDDH